MKNLVFLFLLISTVSFGQIPLRYGGSIVSFNGVVSQAPTFWDFVPINEYFALSNPDSLSIPSPVVGSDEVLHPDIWDMGTQWNGYRYWMAFTPLPTVDPDDNENPCIVVSNDKTTWIVPPGGSNPITPTPPVSYNSDTELYFENNTLYCFYRTWTDTPSSRPFLAYKSSTDGITWSTQGEMTISGLPYPLDNSDLVSPSIIKAGSEYRLYAVARETPDVNSYSYFVSSTSLLGDYTDKTRIHLDSSQTILNDLFPLLGWYTWHPNLNVYNGKYFFLVYMRGENASTAEMKEAIWLAESNDGISFTLAKAPLFQNRYTTAAGIATTPFVGWDGTYYRSAMLPKDINGELGWDIWYSAFASYRDVYPDYIGYSEILPVKSHITYTEGGINTISTARQAQIDSANLKQGDYIFCDDFQRTETGLTTSSSGNNYIAGILGTFAVSNSLKASALSYFYMELGVTDYEISVDAKMHDQAYTSNASGNGFRVRLKYLDGGSYFNCRSGRRFNLLGDATSDLQNDYLIQPFLQDDINNFKWRVVGDNVKYYVNNKLVIDFDVTESNVSTVTKDAVMAATQFFLLIENTSTEIFNITAKSL